MKTIAALVSASAIFSIVAVAQEASDNSAEKNATIAGDRAYEAAYAKGDVQAMADFFADDAQYTADDGRRYDGRAAIAESIKATIEAGKGAKLKINPALFRLLSPDVLMEKGVTTVTAKNGETGGAQYTAVYVKKDGKWKISQLIESPLPNPSPHDQLSQLAWLIGSWQEADKSDDLTVDSQYVWAKSGNFITRNVTVKRSGDTTMEGWQVIGWDPIANGIRSWTFDDEGGFSEGRWTRNGESWLLRETGVTPDGDRTTADNSYIKVSDDRFTWESNNRTLNGDPQPAIARIEINRAKGN